MAVEVIDVSKTFDSGVRALADVSLSCPDGELTAVVGANGSGKSTLAKVLSGFHRPDGGALRIDTVTTAGFHSPAEAMAAGVRIVHQEAPLVNLLDVAEAMALFSAYPTGIAGRIRWRELNRRAAAQLETLGIPIDPRRSCGTLTAAERAMVSLAIALGRGGTRLLILDEVTASLTEREASTFLGWIRDLISKGSPVLMVTHRLEELGYADSVVVLREGRIVAKHPRGVDEDQIVAEIVGESAFLERHRDRSATGRASVARLWAGATSAKTPTSHTPSGGTGPVLDVQELCGDVVADFRLALHGGEVVGIAGLRGSGVEEIPYLLSGNKARRKGTICVLGRAMTEHPSPSEARGLGISFLPADRLTQGGVASLPVSANIVLPELIRFWHRPREEREIADLVVESLDVRPPSRTIKFGKLSGGNQQKVLLGKWLRLGPAVLILDDPTNGVDPGARQILFEAVFEAASAGMGVLLLSSEPEQLVAHCDRVLVVREGRVTHELERGEEGGDDALTLDTLMRWAYA